MITFSKFKFDFPSIRNQLLSYLYAVNMFDFIFRLGVLFAIYGFIWGIIELAITMLNSGRKRTLGEIYLIRALKYFFLIDVTFLFCLDRTGTNEIVINQIIFAGLILLTYFIGKLQNNQKKKMLFQAQFGAAGNNSPLMNSPFNIKAEMTIIIISLIIFGGFTFAPSLAYNPMSVWFLESIINIENTPIFGFVFKIIGFFFLLTLIFKMTNAISFILSGGKSNTPKGNDFDDDSSTKKFDDYTEVE